MPDTTRREFSRCWSDVLREQGYSLGYIGKWHLDSPYRPYVDTSNNNENFAWNGRSGRRSSRPGPAS